MLSLSEDFTFLLPCMNCHLCRAVPHHLVPANSFQQMGLHHTAMLVSTSTPSHLPLPISALLVALHSAAVAYPTTPADLRHLLPPRRSVVEVSWRASSCLGQVHLISRRKKMAKVSWGQWGVVGYRAECRAAECRVVKTVQMEDRWRGEVGVHAVVNAGGLQRTQILDMWPHAAICLWRLVVTTICSVLL